MIISVKEARKVLGKQYENMSDEEIEHVVVCLHGIAKEYLEDHFIKMKSSKDHVAIMKKSWGLTQKILTGQKKIESRWYKTKAAPWGRIRQGDVIYFRDSGELVSIRAEVEKVLQFDGLNPKKVQEILDKYGSLDGIEKKNIPTYYEMFKDKKYCMLIFLKNAQKVDKPFQIDKTGYGMMSAWMCVDDINKVIVD